MNDRHFATFDIAGFTYYDGIDVFYDLKIGTELNLKAEPTNPFDPYAVIIYYKTTKLGYIPRGENKAISRFLNLGYTELFEVKINRIAPDEHTEQQVGVIVRIRERKAKTNDLMDKCDASEEKNDNIKNGNVEK